MSFLRRLFEPSAPPHAVDAYAADLPLWVDGLAAATLATLERQRFARLERLAARLARADARTSGPALDLPALLDAAPRDRAASFCAALDRWVADPAWASPLRRDYAEPALFEATQWPAAAAGVYTLISDLGIALGEAVLRCRPECAWSIDRYDAHGADGDRSFGRVVVLDPRVPHDARDPAVCDCIDAAFCAWQALALRQPQEPFAQALRPLLWRPGP